MLNLDKPKETKMVEVGEVGKVVFANGHKDHCVDPVQIHQAQTSSEATEILESLANESRHVGSQGALAAKDRADESRNTGVQFAMAAKDRGDQDRYIAGEFSRTQLEVASVRSSLKDEICEAKERVLENRFEANKDTLTNRFELSKEILESRRLSDLSADRWGHRNELAIEKTAAAQALALEERTSTIRREAAECCCELKEKISDDGQRTRDLINQIERDRQAVCLADAKAEVLALRARLPLSV